MPRDSDTNHSATVSPSMEHCRRFIGRSCRDSRIMAADAEAGRVIITPGFVGWEKNGAKASLELTDFIGNPFR